jgi:alcohol dehydrogenase
MRQLTYIRPDRLDWWGVPAPRLQDDGDGIVRPLAVTRCDLEAIKDPTIKVVLLREGIE